MNMMKKHLKEYQKIEIMNNIEDMKQCDKIMNFTLYLHLFHI
jgi:hypothetical protein